MEASKAIKEVEEWLELNDTIDYLISCVELNGNGGYRVVVEETAGDENTYWFTVEPDGRLINMNGDDCVKTAKDAYDNDKDFLYHLVHFENKWCNKEGVNKPITLYGITIVNSEGFDGGNESTTRIFTKESEAYNYAYIAYKTCFENYQFDNGVDDNGNSLMTPDEFDAELFHKGYVLIQGYDSHCQIEQFVASAIKEE